MIAAPTFRFAAGLYICSCTVEAVVADSRARSAITSPASLSSLSLLALCHAVRVMSSTASSRWNMMIVRCCARGCDAPVQLGYPSDADGFAWGADGPLRVTNRLDVGSIHQSTGALSPFETRAATALRSRISKNGLTMSSGIGKTTVVFCSPPISESVCK